jgi:hypothetical protein
VSDASQGPGWWQASDGKWYPPEQAPGYQPPGAPAGGGAPGTIDVGALFQWSWAKFQANIQPLLILGAVVAGVPFLIALMSLFISGIAGTALWLLSVAAGFVLALLTVQAGLEVATTGALDQQNMFKIKANLGNFILGAILFSIAAFIGCLLLCVGLIFVYLIFGLWSYVVVDEDAGAIQAFTRSKDLVLGPGLGNTFIPMLLFLIFNSGSGFLAGGSRFAGLIGVFFAPFGALIGGYVFKSLKGEPIAP